MVPEDRKILILSDSQAAIAAVRKAGRTGRARAGELKEVVEEVTRRQQNLGPNAVRFAWVEAHVGIHDHEMVDQMAKAGAELGDEDEGMGKVIMEGKLRQEWRRRREREEQRRERSRGRGWEELLGGTARRGSITSTVAREKATYKPGDMS